MEETLFDGSLILDGGYRQDTKHIDNSSTSTANDDANNDVDMAPAEIFALGAHWQMTDVYSLDGRYYQGHQGIVGDFDMCSESGDLHLERQDRVEIALAAKLAPYFRPALTWFRIDTKNAKSASSHTYELDGATYYYYSESDELRKGVELAIQGDIFQNTSYKFSWTHMLDNESTEDGHTSDSIGKSNPRNLYSLALSHRWNEYRANLSIKQVDEWTDSSSPMGLAQTEGLGGYTRIDANIQRDFKLKDLLLSVTLFGRNMRDENYATRYVTGYYPDRGRTFGVVVALAY